MGGSVPEVDRKPSPSLGRAILATPLLIEIGACALFGLLHFPVEWAGAMLVALFVVVPLSFGVAANSLAAMSLGNYAKVASTFVPASMLFNLVFLFAVCASISR